MADPDLELVGRKGIVARMLRALADVGVLEQYDYLVLLGRIEKAKDRAELDGIQAEVERLARPEQ